VAGSCKHGTEPSGSMKGGKFLDSACQEGHYLFVHDIEMK
jgi:hypothetical protein